MHIIFAERMQQVKDSPTLAISAKAMQMQADGIDVINLGVGEPDFDTPQYIKDAAISAINSGFTKYTAVDGVMELKQAIINKFQRYNQLNYQLKQIIVSTGGKQSIYNLCQALLNHEDEVLIPAPYWVSYPDIVLLASACPVIIAANSNNNYKITARQLEQAITPKTKLFFLNSPSNPSGVAYNLQELQELGAVLRKYPQILIATDDMYEHIIWRQPFINIINACPDLYERTIILNGVSKAYAMTGWRIGYAAGANNIIAAMKMIQSQSTSNPCAIAQKAAIAALNGNDESIHNMVIEFKKRHDYVIERLRVLLDLDIIPADGTFYLFPDMQKIISRLGYNNDNEFAQQLLQQTGVALVPGSAFGNEGCMRLSFAISFDKLRDAMDRLIKFCQ